MKVYRLWEGDAPGTQGSGEADIPTLTDYAEAGSGKKAGCVVCPGGGYGMLADHEGRPVAEWFEKIGIRGFVLRYRLGPKYHHPVMLHDAERAIRYVRAHADALGVDANRVGVLGFSAGGHLASTVSTHGRDGQASSADPIDRESSLPNWSVLIYPVITLQGPYAHVGSRENLLGKNPDAATVEGLSNANAVSLSTPKTYICHGANDDAVPVQNSLEYTKALADHRIPFELLVPHHGPHGFGLRKDWTDGCEHWARDLGLA